MPMRNQQAPIRCLGGDMSADSANETEEENGPGPTDASFSLDERTLSEEERQSVDAAIGPLVEHDGSLPVEIDGSLIAGLELRSRHGVIRNSLGSDLDRVAKALAENEQA